MDQKIAQDFIDEIWTDSIVPELVEYIKIPNKSPHFDADWAEHGYMEDAVQQIFNLGGTRVVAVLFRWCPQGQKSGL